MEIKTNKYELYQGDCLEVMDKLIEEEVKVDAIIADIPYGTTQNKWDSVIPLDEMWKRLNKLIKNNTPIVLFAQTPFDKRLGNSNLEMLKYEWIWRKNKPTGHLNSKKMPLKEHENILVFYKKLPTYNPQGLIKKEIPTIRKRQYNGSNYGDSDKDAIQEYYNYPKSILDFNSVTENVHPTQKPVALLEYLVKTYTNKGDLVLDFTMGSGSTGVACKHTNRKFIGIELDEKYFEIAKNRIKNEPLRLI
jgi:site-specific DNA-methyltransferase (adenine-specific)